MNKFFTLLLSLLSMTLSAEQYYYNGIPGCHCFQHCKCFSIYMGPFSKEDASLKAGAFPEDTPLHPYHPEDIVWHEFMKGILKAKEAGPIIAWDEDELRSTLNFYDYGDICLLSEYYEAIANFRKKINQAKKEWIKHYNGKFTKPKDQKIKQDKIAMVEKRASDANQILNETKDKVTTLYQNILNSCPHEKIDNQAYIENALLLKR